MEVAGLAIGIVGILDISLRITKEIDGFVRDFKSVGWEFQWASKRLDIYNVQFKNWIEFWDIHERTPFHTLWGPEGTNAINDHLKGIKILCTRAAESQEKYKRTLEKEYKRTLEKEHKRTLSEGRYLTLEKANKYQPNTLRLLRDKIRYAVSGKNEFKEVFDNLRMEFGLVEQEAMDFFVRCHPNTSRGSVSRAMIDDLVKEQGMMDRAMKTQQTTMHLFNGLEVKNLQLTLDLSLQPDYVSKKQFRELEFDTRRLNKKSAKLPIIVNDPGSAPSHQWRHSLQSVFVLEAGEESRFDTSLRIKKFNSIVILDQSRRRANDTSTNLGHDVKFESFSLKCPPNIKYDGNRFLVHSTGTNVISEPRRLNELFDNDPRHQSQHPSRTNFPITWQFDLAYTLAASVLYLQGSGWLTTFHSGNIYQRENPHRSTIHTLRVCGSDINYNLKKTPLDKVFRRPNYSHDLGPEIFLLGVILLEIGLARSGSAILEDVGHIKTSEQKIAEIYVRLDNSVCPIYTDITRTCLEGDFEFDDDMDRQKILKSYISKVLEPLRKQCDNLRGSRGPRGHQMRKIPETTMPIALKEITYPEWNSYGNIDTGIKGLKGRISTWDSTLSV
ncbi:hypothetical protein DFP73DRAFT_542802 [Morchella snyderi]|nr:hypothetical protein DFP73DRAFT_542802 [Morchella snyderi]